jgi:mono/diheme cytochrome c family protein
VLALLIATGGSCDWDYERMIDQPNAKAYEPNPYLPGGTTLQPAPLGTVAREATVGPTRLVTGVENGRYLESIPIAVSRTVLERGRSRFEIICATCHGLLGDGQSQVAKNMKRVPPPSLHQERLRAFPAGRLFVVASQGYGLMPGYAQRLEVEDRWALVAYVQALQLSQHIRLEELPPSIHEEARQWLE